jgi:hypothetical protein
MVQKPLPIKSADKPLDIKKPRSLELAKPKPNYPALYAPYLPNRPAFASAKVIKCFASNCPSPPVMHDVSLNVL